MRRRRIVWTVLLGSFFAALPGAASPAVSRAEETAAVAEIRWRTDYGQAIKEASEKKLPLAIDVGTTNCFWCKKLDETTFRDPHVIRALNDSFIPLKINGDRDAALVQQLKITSYPTVVLAGPDKRILDTIEGYQEAEKFRDRLQRIVSSLTPSDWMTRDLASAAKWMTSGDYSRAIPLLRTLVDDARAKPLHAQANKLLQDLEQKAGQQLAQARDLHQKGHTAEAIDAVTETMRLFPGLEATRTAASTLTEMVKVPEAQNQHRLKRAHELLLQAKDFYQSRDYIPSLDRCELLLASYGDLPEGQEASKIANEIKSNPEWLQGACDTLSERLGGLYLALADSLLKRGDPQRAEFYLQRIIQAFPGSRQAESAQIRLGQLQGVYSRKGETQTSAGP
jgi:thioredoxin-like negative regulator of GroEL